MRRANKSFLVALLAVFAFASTADAAKTAKPNLKASAVTAFPTAVNAGSNTTVTARVGNGPKASAKATRTDLWISQDATLGTGDTKLGAVKTAKLKAKKKKSITLAVTIPAAQLAGAYKILVCADGAKKVKETSERDNCAAGDITITVAAPTAPAPTGPTGPPAPIDTDLDGLVDTADNCVAIANPDQADADSDAKGDVCDECPSYANPGGNYCQTTVANVRTGADPSGAQREIQNLVITAKLANSLWVQDVGGGAPNGGMEIHFASGAPLVSVGAVITVTGTVRSDTDLDGEAVLVTGSAPGPVVPLLITAATLNANPLAYRSLLVKIASPTSVYMGTFGVGGWLLSQSANNYGVLPTFTSLSSPVAGYDIVIGISGYDGTNTFLRPRSNADWQETV